MKKLLLLGFAVILLGTSKAQLSGVVTVPGTYTSIGAAINDLNLQGVNGALTVNIAAGYTETAPSGGYFLTATGTAANPITFKKNGVGANPLITAYTGTATPGTANLQDGVWTLVGSDYITIDGIDITDPNTTNPATMEYGYGLYKASATDGSQNNTIRNCVIALSRNNNATGTGPSFDGSRGINLTNSTINAQTTNLTVTAASGGNSNNRFYNNVIQNVNIGIALSGFAATAPYTLADTGNDVGGTSAATSNTIINFGGGGTTSPAAAIRTINQYDFNASYNIINNNTGTGVNHATTLRGIYVNTASGANSTINNNTLTIHSNVTTAQVSVIENASGTTANSNTVSINNNLIAGCTNTLATSSIWYGIYNLGSPMDLLMSNNTFTNNTTNATTGNVRHIYNTAGPSGNIDISNNYFEHDFIGTVASSGIRYCIYSSAAAGSTLNINNNNFGAFNYTTTRTGTDYYIYTTGSASVVTLDNNSWINQTYNHSGSEYYIYNITGISNQLSVNSNTINNITRTASAALTYFYYGSNTGISTQTISNNLFSNYTATVAGTGALYGIYAIGGTSPYPKKLVYNNIISNINSSNSGIFYGVYVNSMGEGSSTSGSEIYNNQVNNVSCAGTTYGLYFSTLSSPNFANSVYTNTVSNLVTNGATSAIYAAYLASGSTSGGLIFRNNKLYDVTNQGGFNYGLFCTTTSTTTISNNLIGNFNVTTAGGTNRLNGIYLNAGNNYNIYYNSIYLNGTSTGLDFGSNGIYASTTPNVLMQNNIVVNNSTPTGIGIAAAYRRSSATLTTYSNLSNNNLFYAGVPSATTVIFHDGTNAAQTLGAYQGIVGPADGLSITENPTFVSTIGNNPNFLNINTVTPTQIESAGTPVTGITTDYIGTTRNATTPDIGAWEGNYTLLTCSGTPSAGVSAISASLGCTGNPFNVSTSNQSTGAGITYQWFTAPSATGPWSSIPNATTSIHTTTSNAVTFYQLVVTCSVSAQSATTAPVSYTPTNCYNMSNTTVTACSGLIYDSGGSTANYQNSEDYTLTIVPSTPGAMAQLTFNNFNIENGWDYLYIYDGPNTLAPLTGSYTGTTPPPVTTATNITGQLTLRFTSDGSVTNPGFEASIACITPPTCSSTPNSGTATVSSPTSCINTGVTLGANGLDTGLGIQYQWFSAPSATGPWSAIPSATLGSYFTTTTVTTFYQIVTTCTVSAQSATSTVVSYTPSNCYTMNNGTITTCAGTLYDTGGPNNDYQNNESYTLTIVPSTPSASTTLTFLNFNTESGFDELAIYDGPNTLAPLIGQYSGATLPPAVTATNSAGVITLQFTSDGSVVNPGFEIALSCSVSCSGPPSAPTATGASICSGNSATLTATPSNSGTAQWYSSSTSTNYIAQGTTFVTPVLTVNTTYYVLDSTSCGLSTLTAVDVTVTPIPSLSVSASNTTICEGSTATLTASGVDSYTWSTSATTSVIAVSPTVTTTYTVDGLFTQCNALQSEIITVNVNSLPSVSLSAAVSTICVLNGSISLTGTPAGGIYSGTAVTGSLLSVANAGTFTPMYSYTNTLTGCSNTATTQVIVSNCTGVDEAGFSTNGIRVYPNPNSGSFMIETNNIIEKTIEVMDVTGRVIISEKSNIDRVLMNISDLANGVYQVRIISEKGTDMIKVIKQ